MLSSSISLPCTDDSATLETTNTKHERGQTLIQILCLLIWALVAVKPMGDLLLEEAPENVPWRL